MMDTWDHPRMCGEKENFREPGRVRVRSPPRMRGKDSPENKEISGRGITPAYAGKSWNSLALKCLLMGSPPRMRGKDSLRPAVASTMGITPAYAGKSRICTADMDNAMGSPPRMRGKAGSRSASGSACRDHPRVCGEKQRKWMPRICTKGSPPRMRGKGIEQSNCRVGMRITPAYAGKRLKRSRSTVSPVAIVPLFPSVCNKLVVSDGSPAGRDAPLFLPAENAVPASPAYNLRSL